MLCEVRAGSDVQLEAGFTWNEKAGDYISVICNGLMLVLCLTLAGVLSFKSKSNKRYTIPSLILIIVASAMSLYVYVKILHTETDSGNNKARYNEISAVLFSSFHYIFAL